MQTLLLTLTVLLFVAICALAGFWIFRPRREQTRKSRSPRIAPRAAGTDPWTLTVRPSRDRA